VWLDTELTPELEEEGTVRTLMRRAQEWRKEQGYTILDRPAGMLAVLPEERGIAEKYREQIMKEAHFESLEFTHKDE
jgi:hypothetical protein